MTVRLPKWLERTPAEIAEEDNVQALRRASFGRAHKTREEELVGRGALLEETARGNLAAGDGEGSRALLAEGLAMQGRYLEAAKHAPDKEMKAHYRAINAAIKMPDSRKCRCPDLTGKVDGVDIALTPRFAAKEVFSQKHGKAVQLITCVSCGHVNAREPSGRLLLAQTNQNRVAAASGRGMVRDSQLFKVNDRAK